MNPLPHFALGQWHAIGRRMYLSNYAHSGDRMFLSHKPVEARPFLSADDALAFREECAARIRWEDYKESALPRSRTLEVCEVTDATVLCVYPDGSGLASEYVRQTMDCLGRYEAHCSTLRAFIQRYLGRLAGLSWRGDCHYDLPHLRIDARAYRGSYEITAREVALMWPEIGWKRKKHEYPPEGYIIYDWVGVLDGVEVAINDAEQIRVKPVDTGRDGTRVDLESGVAK